MLSDQGVVSTRRFGGKRETGRSVWPAAASKAVCSEAADTANVSPDCRGTSHAGPIRRPFPRKRFQRSRGPDLIAVGENIQVPRGQERRAAAERQAEVERKQREEEARRQSLEQEAAQWAHSQNIPAFLQAVHQEAARRGVPLDRDSPLGQWLAWAHEHAERLDPLGELPSGSNAGTP